MTAIPAARNTFVLKITGPKRHRKIPVIAWMVGSRGDLQPLAIEPFDRAVIMYPCGRVFDRETQTAFDDEIDWFAEMFA